MIILKHLMVERFRLLRGIDLHFPQRGSILISGPNEAGKSALLESIYFALYGESLVSDAKRNSSSLDELVRYGEAQASVTLTLSIGVTELTITRTIERGKGQSVTLSVRQLGMPEEKPITRLSEANQRIIAELGRMDGETLRNSCLIEQKGLNRLENLSSSQREATLRKLLGLEQLVQLSEQFKLTEHDEKLLNECRLRLKLAEVQARIPELSMQLGQIEAALDAVTVTEDLAEINQQNAEIAEQEISLEQLSAKRNELKGRQSRIAQLKKADTILGEIIDAYDAIAEAQRELPELERQVAELERRERNELPALENRVHDLSELTRSFGTLERMAADLLAAVNNIKALEQELKVHEDIQDDLSELDEQIIAARLQVEQARQSQHELEERDRAARPQLNARLQRLQTLAERVKALSEAEERYTQHILQQGLAEENSAQLKKVQRELRETEQELALVENEARQLQQQADTVENHWRQVSIGRQLEEWRRLKGLSQGLVDAEQHVRAAHQQQEQLTLLTLAARRTVTKNMGIAIACITLFLLCGSAALLLALHSEYVYATIAGLASLLLVAGAGLSLQNYSRSREEEKVADAHMQDAISRVGMMVAAREAAGRIASGSAGSAIGGSGKNYEDALAQVEHELHSLGSTIPHSLDEAESLLQQMPDPSQSVADIQQRMTESRNSALAARNQVNVTMEAVAVLRKERTRLDEQRQQEGWDNLSEQLLSDAAAIEQMRHEIASSAGQEGLPIPDFESTPETAPETVHISETATASTSVPTSVGASAELAERVSNPSRPSPSAELAERVSIPRPRTDVLAQFKTQVEDAIRSTEREIAALDGKLDLLPELKTQVDVHQAVLDLLLARKQSIGARIYTRSANSAEVLPHGRQGEELAPASVGAGEGGEPSFRSASTIGEQIEKARQQQVTLRNALRTLQDSLRERVQKLGVSFGQAAISTAEVAARKQLESLHIILGQRVELESRYATYATKLRDCQETLSEHYAQLAKLSGTLGSWIVPPSPFAEDLSALRARCRQEMREANEEATLRELEALDIQGGASRAKIALCQAEIEAAHERIATLLAQRNRPPAKGYGLGDIVAVWPLVGEHSPEDQEPLQAEAAAIEQELHELEEQEVTLSGTMTLPGSTGTTRIDLAQARKRMEQQERVYETKKRGSLLVHAVQDRLMQKMLPRTEYYMQQLLPPLTRGRFHDARLTTVYLSSGQDSNPPDSVPVGADLSRPSLIYRPETDAPAGGTWQLSVWEPQAFDYIPRSSLSGGTVDLLSLALRLAFAIAALPRELSTAPGFLLLDEPLGASDSERARALVELVTGPILSSHFEQIVLVSHSGAWNPALFAYHVYIDAGQMVESNLPVPASVAEVPDAHGVADATRGTVLSGIPHP